MKENSPMIFIPNVLICLTRIVSAIVCPLIMIVLPASFYIHMKKEFEAFQTGSEFTWAARIGVWIFFIFGLLLLPIFLTMASLFMLNQ